MDEKQKEFFMNEAYKEALKAYKKDEVPVGAVVVLDGMIIARAHNNREKKQLIEGHAEFLAMKKAAKKIGSWRLEDTSVFVTMEPCPMCGGAMIQSRVKNCYFATYDLKNGVSNSIIEMFELPFNHKVNCEYVDDGGKSSQLLKEFFKKLRRKK
ncbi:nucleoside deaminase [Haploplasma axanthum]|uniref:Cytosine deaminase n=1 Tax=Haploplasma axanthum TaxID=29552 RepID=A0A449BB95_HAPAX|nr:nucleoside deaminase [Haploplasma axanthum]VEU79653.1 Cytosine deaminase [Haploplasma axanthum]